MKTPEDCPHRVDHGTFLRENPATLATGPQYEQAFFCRVLYDGHATSGSVTLPLCRQTGGIPEDCPVARGKNNNIIFS